MGLCMPNESRGPPYHVKTFGSGDGLPWCMNISGDRVDYDKFFNKETGILNAMRRLHIDVLGNKIESLDTKAADFRPCCYIPRSASTVPEDVPTVGQIEAMRT